LITDHIPRKSSKPTEIANRRRHTGLETIIDLVIIDLVKSDAAGTAWATRHGQHGMGNTAWANSCQMSPC
jgi:hypothetical protein